MPSYAGCSTPKILPSGSLKYCEQPYSRYFLSVDRDRSAGSQDRGLRFVERRDADRADVSVHCCVHKRYASAARDDPPVDTRSFARAHEPILEGPIPLRDFPTKDGRVEATCDLRIAGMNFEV